MLTRRHLLGCLAVAPFTASPAFARGPAVFSVGGRAIHGFDPVTYFQLSGPIEGQDRFRLMWRNAVWQFASQSNLATFERDPHRFAPRYGGYCAMSLTAGTVSRTQPDAWAIHDGRLYLTHSVVARDRWRQDPEAYIAKADAHWPTALCP